ncbi:MAG TPA: hypothetical protein ACFYEK_11060 [Candidatus Wunengus sp. YC60]|uniref:hypothetical protein n=1 Tax=Candidatus Wunengus sp. YC60 TaxID=3367697 RepID=UPI004028680D
MNLEKLRERVSWIIENHRKHGLLMEESLELVRTGADIALVVVKWELEKGGTNVDREISKSLQTHGDRRTSRAETQRQKYDNY